MERPEGLGWCRKVCRTLTWRAVGVSGPSWTDSLLWEWGWGLHPGLGGGWVGEVLKR